MRGEMSNGWREMTDMLNEQQRIANELHDLCKRQEGTIHSLEAKVERLTKVLRPFAELDIRYEGVGADDYFINSEDITNARVALKEEE